MLIYFVRKIGEVFMLVLMSRGLYEPPQYWIKQLHCSVTKNLKDPKFRKRPKKGPIS